VAGRVPVLGQDDVGEASAKRVDRLDHRTAVRHRKRAAGQEVVLDVDDDQDVVRARIDSHLNPPGTGEATGAFRRVDTLDPGLTLSADDFSVF
jgi:hypothetical protein